MEFKYNNVTIVLQGILNQEINLIDTLELYTKLCKVILSIYTTDMEAVTKICQNFPSVTIVENHLEEYEKLSVIVDPEFRHCNAKSLQNGIFQICTTKKGLDIVNTEYVVKSRIDHYYSGITKFIEYGLLKKKIISSSIFMRGCKDTYCSCRYCLSDCLFMGKSTDIKLCFELCYNTRVLTRPETGIWKPYFLHIFNKRGIDINSVDDETYVKYMAELVEIYCVNYMHPYRLKICNRIETHMWDKAKSTEDYLIHGCDYK